MAVSEYGQVILHNYNLSNLISVFYCASYFHFANLPKFLLLIHSGSHFVSQYESIISIYWVVKALSTLMTLVESIRYLIWAIETQTMTEIAIFVLIPYLDVPVR